MARCEKLLDKARNSPNDLRIAELCKLAECHDWVFARGKGSHRIYKRPGTPGIMNFQADKHGKAKAFQVKQLLAAIDDSVGTGGDADAKV